ncbi:MAG TPA: hypothetical protein VHV08_01685 [Pirellulales bacterium]|nr:hypothetical protein [Pirellulales bacterium]
MLTSRVMLAVMGFGAALLLAAGPAWARTSDSALRLRPVSSESIKLSQGCPPEPCCPTPCVIYRHHGPKLCCDCCKPGTPTVLKVKNPCTGCETDITVCLPSCCTGEPAISPGTGAFCRDVICYEWCCGFQVRVIFKRCGDLIVTTWGR